MKTFRAQGKAARGLTRDGNTSEGKWGPESGPGLRLLSKVDVGSLTAHTSRHHQVGVRLWEAAGLRSQGEEGAVWRSPQTSQSRALTLGHHRSCWVPRKTRDVVFSVLDTADAAGCLGRAENRWGPAGGLWPGGGREKSRGRAPWLLWGGGSWLALVACLMGVLGWWQPWLERKEASWREVRLAAL